MSPFGGGCGGKWVAGGGLLKDKRKKIKVVDACI